MRKQEYQLRRIQMAKRIVLPSRIPEGKRIGSFRGMDVYVEGDIGQDDWFCVYVYRRLKSKNTKSRQTIAELTLSDDYCKGAYHVDLMRIDHRYQGHGIAPMLYRYLMKKLGIILQAGTMQSGGGRRLWAELAKMKDIMVYASYKRKHEAHVIELEKEDEELHLDGIRLYDGRPIYTFATYCNDRLENGEKSLGKF